MQIVSWNGGAVSRIPVLRFKDEFRRQCSLTLWSHADEAVDLMIQQSHARVLVVLVEAFIEQKDERMLTRGFLKPEDIGDCMAGFARGRVITREAVIDHIYGLRKLMRPSPRLIECRDGYGYRIAPCGLRVDGD